MVAGQLEWVVTIEAEAMLKKPEKSLPMGLMEISMRVKKGSYLKLLDKVLDALEKRVSCSLTVPLLQYSAMATYKEPAQHVRKRSPSKEFCTME